MSRAKKFKKAYAKELALELKGRKKKQKGSKEDLDLLTADAEARNYRRSN